MASEQALRLQSFFAMSVRGLSAIILVGVMGLGLMGCSEGDKKRPSTTRETYFIQGDPRDLVKGAITNTELPFSTQRPQEYENAYLVHHSQFRSRIKPPKENDPEKQRSNNPTLIPERESLVSYKTKEIIFHGLDLLVYGPHQADGQKMYFERLNDDRLAFKDFENYQLIHFSRSEDGKYFSFLTYFEVKATGESMLDSMIFSTHKRYLSHYEVDKSAEEYFYLFGPGVKTTWRESLVMNSCYNGPGAELFYHRVKESADLWNKSAGVNLVTVKRLRDYPPFSDLNTRCYYLSPKFRYGKAAGVAMNRHRKVDSHFLDSDVFLFDFKLRRKKESFAGRSKGNSTFTNDLKLHVFLHEMGHVLGLHHKFRLSESDPYVPSVMSYSGNNYTKPQDYDRKAIKTLYDLW